MIISAPVEVEKCFSQPARTNTTACPASTDSRFLAILIDNEVRLFRFDKAGLTKVS
jgi:hypothetical protein